MNKKKKTVKSQASVDSNQQPPVRSRQLSKVKQNEVVAQNLKKSEKRESKKGRAEKKSVSFDAINKQLLINKKSKNLDELNDFIRKADNHIFQDLYLNPDSVFLLAVSGGVDSMTMLDLFANLTVNFPMLMLCVAHFNHKIRPVNSDKDLEFVKEICSKYNIPFFSESADVKDYSEKKGISIELAARVLRYRFLEKIAQKVQANYIATAHTADDSAETFFINLFRGSGLTGLSGIPAKRNLSRKVTLVRPLLFLRKNELIKYAKARDIKWREDETNQLLHYTRNKIRLDIIPKIEEHFSPSVIGNITRTQKLLQSADNIITKFINKTIPVLIKDRTSGRFSIKLSQFSTLDPFLQGEIIQKVLSNYFNLSSIPMQTIDRILELEEKPIGSVCEINKNYIVLRDRDSLIFSQVGKPSEIFIPIKKEGEFNINGMIIKLEQVKKKQVKFTMNPNIEFIDWDLVPSVLYLRNWKQGDAFHPLGMEGSMKVSDFLTNQKVSLIDKNNIILLATKSDIIWICGMRLNNKFKVTDNTFKYLKIEYSVAKENLK